MKALILAAGYATRLYPLTLNFPKPLLSVGRRRMIDYIMDKVKALDEVDEIFVVVNHKFISLFKKWKKRQQTKVKISLVDDGSVGLDDKLGAIGDMNFAITKKKIKDDLLVIGGDNLFDSGLKGFLSSAKRNSPSPSIGVFDVKSRSKARKYGIIKADKSGRILDFQEKPKKPKATLAAMCVYFFPKKGLKLFKEYFKDKKNKRDATGFYIDWLRRRTPTFAFAFGGRWFDIGDKKTYKEVKRSYGRT
ncbi:nucleotidyltransferase family protein [Candidatus Omnitrophota bacterium]